MFGLWQRQREAFPLELVPQPPDSLVQRLLHPTPQLNRQNLGVRTLLSFPHAVLIPGAEGREDEQTASKIRDWCQEKGMRHSWKETAQNGTTILTSLGLGFET